MARTLSLALAADQRLAFRELGLAIGLHGIESRLGLLSSERDLMPAVAALAPHLPLAGRIEAFWADPPSRRARSWIEHREINMVMLATSLAPAGYLGT